MSDPTDSLGAPLVPDTIVCVDCGSTAHLLSKPDETGRFWPGDLVAYRCEDCLDRWDLIVPEEGDGADGRPDW
jgi:hypothetical protein